MSNLQEKDIKRIEMLLRNAQQALKQAEDIVYRARGGKPVDNLLPGQLPLSFKNPPISPNRDKQRRIV